MKLDQAFDRLRFQREVGHTRIHEKLVILVWGKVGLTRKGEELVSRVTGEGRYIVSAPGTVGVDDKAQAFLTKLEGEL